MKIIYEQEPTGCCPVQAEGTIDGLPFYFRSRHAHWALSITKTKEGSPMDYKNCFYHRELYDGVNRDEPAIVKGLESLGPIQFGAGWAEEEECKAFIEKTAKMLLQNNNE